MSTLINQQNASAIRTLPLEQWSTTFGAIGVLIAIVMLVFIVVSNASQHPKNVSWVKALIVITLPLLVSFSVVILARLLRFLTT